MYNTDGLGQLIFDARFVIEWYEAFDKAREGEWNTFNCISYNASAAGTQSRLELCLKVSCEWYDTYG